MAFERRRSQRILMRVPGRIYGSRKDRSIIYEEIYTELVSANGGLIGVKEPCDVGMQLLFTNLITEEEIPCRVVYVERNKAGQQQVAIEFTKAAPFFWRVHFPPPDEKPLKKFSGSS